MRGFIAMTRVTLGFVPDRVLTAELQLPPDDYPDPPSVVRFVREVTARLQGQPGIEAAGAVRILPLSRTIGDWSITIEGRPSRPNENPNGDFQAVTPGYFEAMNIRVLRGRAYTDRVPLLACLLPDMTLRDAAALGAPTPKAANG